MPLGAPVESTSETQSDRQGAGLSGRGRDFTLFNDDGKTYAYEKGSGKMTQLHWDDSAGKLAHSGAAAWEGSDSAMVEIVGR